MRKYLFILLVLFSLNLYPDGFFVQGFPKLKKIERGDGLESLSISSIVQDRDEIMWIGAQGGLYRYDGINFKGYTNDPFSLNSLPNDLIQTLTYDEKNHRLLIGTYNGFSIFDIKCETFINYSTESENPISDNVVTSLLVDDRNNIWIGTLDGLNHMAADTGEISLIKTQNSTIRSLYSDSAGLWVGSLGGLELVNIDNFEKAIIPINTPTTFVMDITKSKNRLILGIWGSGVYLLDLKTMEGELLTPHDKRVYKIYKTRDNTLWAGTWGGGLWALSSQGMEYKLTKELGNQIVYSLHEDRGGQLWVGTNGGGISVISPRKVDYTYIKSGIQGIPEGKITSIYRDIDGNLWIAIYGVGLILYDEEFRSYTPYPVGSDIINHITNDSSGYLWVSTNSGLIRVNIDEKSYKSWDELYPHIPLSHSIIYHFNESSDGYIWVSTYGGGLDRINNERSSLINYSKKSKNPINDNIVYITEEDFLGNLWIATNNGLNRLNLNSNKMYLYLHNSSDRTTIGGNNIRSIVEDSNNNIWIGTYSGGLNRYIRSEDAFISYTSTNGMNNNNILSIVEAKSGEVWITTKTGINIIKDPYNTILTLGEEEGFENIFFNRGLYKESSGEILIGGSNGVTKMSSLQNKINNHPPKLLINSIKLFGEEIKEEDIEELLIEYDQKYLEIDFIGVDYESSGKVTYRYILENYDMDWIDGGTRSYVSYSMLPPGRYTFRVKAYNSSMVESINSIELNIRVKKAWFRSWYAFLFYTFIAAAIIFLSTRWRYLVKLKAKNIELDTLNSKLKKISVRDPLTALYNRLYFDQNYIREFHRARRTKHPLGILYIDIDNFKSINDTYGHEVGDKVLREVSSVLSKSIQRDTDFVSRFGGDEFIAILYNTNSDGVELVIDRILDRLKSINTEPVKKAVTISIGVHVGIPDNHISSKMMLQEADKALYKAKKRGKNCTEFSFNSF